MFAALHRRCPVESTHEAEEAERQRFAEFKAGVVEELTDQFRADHGTFIEAIGEMPEAYWPQLKEHLKNDDAIAGFLLIRSWWRAYTKKCAEHHAEKEAEGRWGEDK